MVASIKLGQMDDQTATVGTVYAEVAYAGQSNLTRAAQIFEPLRMHTEFRSERTDHASSRKASVTGRERERKR